MPYFYLKLKQSELDYNKSDCFGLEYTNLA
jgi:hypothetical protein